MKIILIGFMGSGKSTVSQALGKKVGMASVDTDLLIELKAGMKPPEIFEKFGEVRFRELEIEIAHDLQTTTNQIIATGGGVIENKIILDYLKFGGGIVIFLRTEFDEIERRVTSHSRKRPLFQNIDKARKIFEFRQPIYEYYSDAIVDTDDRTIEDIVHEIITITKSYDNRKN